MTTGGFRLMGIHFEVWFPQFVWVWDQLFTEWFYPISLALVLLQWFLNGVLKAIGVI